MTVDVADYAIHPNGKTVKKFILTNKSGASVQIISLGATVTHINVHEKSGRLTDVNLGYSNLEGYLTSKGYLGAMVGRVCGRISEGKFSLDGNQYQLAINNGPNHLHGGKEGFSHKVWDHEVPNAQGNSVIFSYTSPDGEENYPGEVKTRVVYTWTDENELNIDMKATTDKATPVSLTNHAYFNLNGQGVGDVLDHEVTIFSDKVCLADQYSMATGEVALVEQTAFDFRKGGVLGEQLKSHSGAGFDNFYCFNHEGTRKHCATAYSATTGIEMKVYGTQPGLHFYTGHGLDQKGKDGNHYGKFYGFCMEMQGYPDAVNKQQFPSIILLPGNVYYHEVAYKFSTNSK